MIYQDIGFLNKRKLFIIVNCILGVIISFGVILRFNNICTNDFIFYDEGMYLNYNRALGEMIADLSPLSNMQFFDAFNLYIKASLNNVKTLWFLIVDSRFFWGGVKLWYFPRLISAIIGTVTLLIVYSFAKLFYDSKRVAWLSVLLLAILPSHVFYSRTGLQETFSTFLVLAGFYFYLFPKKLSLKTFFSSIFFAGAFFTNYRLIILPIMVALCEGITAISSAHKFNVRKYVWWFTTFLFLIAMIGNIDNGRNAFITGYWVFYQAGLVKEHFDIVNLLSYPYYIFHLENIIFGIFFWGSGYLLIRKEYRDSLPFLLVCLGMLIFSFTGSKGARYLCVLMPFMVMSVANFICFLINQRWHIFCKYVLILCVLIMFLVMGRKAFAVANIHSDYRTATEFLLKKNPNVKFVSTQGYIQNLYTPNISDVALCPDTFSYLITLYNNGYKYLVICPQAYVSLTANPKKFTLKLKGYLGEIISSYEPIKTFEHFNAAVLERFVFEHNSNLRQSIKFLQLAEQQNLGVLRIYDLSEIMQGMLPEEIY